MKKIFSLFSAGALGLLPASASAIIAPRYSYDWPEIIGYSLFWLVSMVLIWLLSPLGVAFTACSLAQFLVPKKAVRIVAWIFQSLIFIFTFLLGIIGIFWGGSEYGEGRYIILIAVLGSVSVICLSIIVTFVSQIIWQKKR